VEEISEPLGADFRIGAAPANHNRIAEIIPPPPLPFDIEALDHGSAAYRIFTGPLIDARIANTEAWRAAEIGALNGHGNARSVARILSVLSRGGTVDGARLLSPETISLIFEEQSHGADLVLGIPLRWGIGYALPETVTVPYAPRGRACYWGGWGGSMVICDLDRGMTIAYMMNRMAPGIIGSDRSEAYVRAVEASLAG
jgi:CubicO group peptidase (beta-lactamase class C family)